MSTALGTDDPSGPRVLLLCDSTGSSNDRKVKDLLDFFDIPWNALNLETFKNSAELPWDRGASKLSILGSASSIAGILQNCPIGLLRVIEKADSVYVYGFEPTEACKTLLRFLTNDEQAGIHPLGRTATYISVNSDFREMCGPLSGMRIPIVPSEGDFFFNLLGKFEGNRSAIVTAEGDRHIFVQLVCRGVRFYLTACAYVIDIHERVLKDFDIKPNFCRAVPIAMYLKSICAGACPTPSETSACLIVDDPLIKTRYGFLHFGRAVELMDEHRFTMSIGFIPWNWRRTDPRAVRLFQARPDRLSLSIHGCDHTRGEFGIHSVTTLNAKTQMAIQRMESLFQRTGLKHDRIMIFPHGKFSPECVHILKVHGIVGAVNTEVTPSPNSLNETEVADVWDVAIERYSAFPIFTRRYSYQGIENFAFDGLLGKPCLIAAHHYDFKDNARELLDFVDSLNSLKWNLRWGSLSDAISHSTRIRHRSDAASIIQLYGSYALVSNPADKTTKVIFIKKALDPDWITGVTANGEGVSWTREGGYFRFEQIILPGQTAEIRVTYGATLSRDPYPSGIGYGARLRFRRYLCELRDNYLSQMFSSRAARPG